MPNPTFVVIGCRKCGTTTLCDLLGAHPDVFMTPLKEPHYFSRLTTFENDRDWYESLFAGTDGYAARGEGSTTYTHPHRIDFVAPRLRSVIPDGRLLYIVRHPIRRLESDWKMRRREERALTNINNAVEVDASLITYGLYWRNLCIYRRLFRDDQILVVFLEDLATDSVAELRRVYTHIGVDPEFAPNDAGRIRNGANGLRATTHLGAIAMRMPWVGRIRQVLPRPIERLARDLLTTEYRDTAEWDPRVLSAVGDLYRRDSAMLLAYCGKSKDYWNLDH